MPPKQDNSSRHRRLSRNEMIERVNEIRAEKGIPIDAAERYEHQNRHHLTRYQKKAVEYLSKQGKDTSFITDPSSHDEHETSIRNRYHEFLNNKRVSKPNSNYSDFDMRTSVRRTSPRRKSPVRESPSKESTLDNENPPRHPRQKSPTRSASPTRSSSPVKNQQTSTNRKRPAETSKRSSPRNKRKQSNEDSTVTFSLFDNFGNERKLIIDLNEKAEYEKTFMQLLEEQCIKMEGQQIMVDDVPCRPDNMVSVSVQSGSQVFLQFTKILVVFDNREIYLPSNKKFAEIKEIFGVPQKLRLFVSQEGSYLPPSAYLANYALTRLSIRTEREISVKLPNSDQDETIFETFPPLELTEALYERCFQNLSDEQCYLYVNRQGKDTLIPPFGATIEDYLRPNDQLTFKDELLNIYYEMDHLDASGTLEIHSSSMVKEIFTQLEIDYRSFDVIRTFDSQILRITEFVACCLMPGFSIKICQKRPLISSISNHYFIQKGKEIKTTSSFSKANLVFDLVQLINKEYPLSLTQKWMVRFNNETMHVPLSIFPEEANLLMTIPTGSLILPIGTVEKNLLVRLSVQGVTIEKLMNPFLSFKENLQQAGFCPDHQQFDCFIQEPSSPHHRLIDMERDMLNIEQNSLIYFNERTDFVDNE